MSFDERVAVFCVVALALNLGWVYGLHRATMANHRGSK